MRIYLAGDVTVESGGRLVRQERFPGAQGRLVFAMLAAEHRRAVPTDQLVDELWGEAPPRSWETALRALVSKVRSALGAVGLPAGALRHATATYRLDLPTDTWIDLEAAAEAIHRAEPALRDGDVAAALGWGRVAASIASRPLLPGTEGGRWLTATRRRLLDVHLRALDCLAEGWVRAGDPQLGSRDAERAVELDPFRETSHRLLMRALADGGNRAGALRAWERCRERLADDLGADPSPETEAVYLEILRSA